MTSYRLELWKHGFLAPNHVVHPLRRLQAPLRARGADPQVIAQWRASTVPRRPCPICGGVGVHLWNCTLNR